VHFVGFTTEIYHDARSHKRQISSECSAALRRIDWYMVYSYF